MLSCHTKTNAVTVYKVTYMFWVCGDALDLEYHIFTDDMMNDLRVRHTSCKDRKHRCTWMVIIDKSSSRTLTASCTCMAGIVLTRSLNVICLLCTPFFVVFFLDALKILDDIIASNLFFFLNITCLDADYSVNKPFTEPGSWKSPFSLFVHWGLSVLSHTTHWILSQDWQSASSVMAQHGLIKLDFLSSPIQHTDTQYIIQNNTEYRKKRKTMLLTEWGLQWHSHVYFLLKCSAFTCSQNTLAVSSRWAMKASDYL